MHAWAAIEGYAYELVVEALLGWKDARGSRLAGAALAGEGHGAVPEFYRRGTQE
jgi:hypothetical protein